MFEFDYRMIVWPMLAIQMGSWILFQIRAGKTTDKQFYIFCVCMLCGQIGTIIECLFNDAWGTIMSQALFAITTTMGGIKRWCNRDILSETEG